MPKRKRGDQSITGSNTIRLEHNFNSTRDSLPSSEETSEINRGLSIQISRLKAKLSQGQTSLTAALKLARGLERQKLGRRQKQAGQANDGQKLLRIKEEIFCLKGIDLVPTAKGYLVKQCLRTKRIAETEALQKVVEEIGVGPADEAGVKRGAEANVLARLFMAAPVKKVVSEIMDGILRVLGLERADARVNGTNGTIQSAEEFGQRGDRNLDEEPFEGFSEPENTIPATRDYYRTDMDIDDEIGSDSADGMDAYADRLGSISDSDSDSFSDVSDQFPNDFSDILPSSKHTIQGQNHDRNHTTNPPLSLSPSLFPSISSAPPPPNQNPSLSKSKSKNPTLSPPSSKPPIPISTLTSTSSFLPTLNTNYYYSGSESGSAPDEDEYTHPNQQPRKNRRGQRARQQIAEKKYGQKAKHLQKQPSLSRNDSKTKINGHGGGGGSGWDARKGAVGNSSDRKSQVGNRTGYGHGYGNGYSRDQNPKDVRTTPGKSNPSQESGQSINAKPPAGAGAGVDKDKKIHPSWEAARKKKMEMKDQGFKGKKITFD